jgi:hypothetical protein
VFHEQRQLLQLSSVDDLSAISHWAHHAVPHYSRDGPNLRKRSFGQRSLIFGHGL